VKASYTLTGALLALVLLPAARSGPVEFGQAEIQRAIKERGLSSKRFRIRPEISTAEPGSFRITGTRITGGDLRGLMYGLLTAADQIRTYGRLLATHGEPATPIRGIRKFLHNKDLEADWYYSRDYWSGFFRMLARNRFNRFNLVFAHQTNYLAPPYPYWVSLKEFPEVKVPGLSDRQRQRNLDTLRFIAQTAADHGIDFTLGIWEQNVQRNQRPTVEGLTPDNIGPYTYAALRKVLAECPAIRSVQVRTNRESGIPPERQVEFFRDYVYKAIRDAGHLVTLDLRGWRMSKGMLEAATHAGMPVRLSTKYWAEHLGRPYQPAEITPNYSYMDFLKKSPGARPGKLRPYDFFWEIWALGSNRLLLWGDPDYVRRAVPTLTLSGSRGFEIDAPLAQMGFGNRPGKWGVFASGQQDRVFWKWDFERYWLFYMLWGRLSYDPKTPAAVWLNELKRRFGDAAPDVLEAYKQASRVLPEIVAVNMPDPNMYMWPEINPGGLIELYRQTLPSDRRFVASFPEAVRNRMQGIPSAKQTPHETAGRLNEIAAAVEKAVTLVRKQLGSTNKEWNGSEPDFRVLAKLARFHAHRQIAADQLSDYDQTADREALETARKELTAALKVWQELVKFTDGLYPPEMAYGPEDTGHWKDKLVYVRHDLETLREREWILDRFGRFDYGFDFGGLMRDRADRFRIEPRFHGVLPGLAYDDERGYGWLGDGERKAVPITTPLRRLMRATAPDPRWLPENLLFGDWISGRGPQTFRVRTSPGQYRVTFLYPDGNITTAERQASGGALDIVFPEGQWRVCGLIVKTTEKQARPARRPWRERPPRPSISHLRPRRATAGRPLHLRLRLRPVTAAATVRLYYRPLNQLAKFKMLEAPAKNPAFTVPGEDLSAEWDLMYYFEVLNKQDTGWFYPDPDQATPYFVVPVEPGARPRR